MTTIRFKRNEHTNHMVSEGHQAGGEGENLYCAAISAMCCTLINALANEELAAAPEVMHGEGYIAVSALRTPRTDAKWPERINLIRQP